MAKISTYPLDAPPELSDKVIGTDVNDSNITKNYLLGDIYTLFQSQIGGGYVPYTGATANVNLGSYSITAGSIIKLGGTSSQFLKADGSVDTSSYVPYIGATANVNIGSYNITANSFVKLGGTSSQFLKADGSVDSNSYVTISTTQTITGLKTFSNTLTLNNVTNTLTDPDKFLVLNGGNAVAYRTGTQLLSDIGGAAAIDYVPYIGATTNVNLNGNSITANSFVKSGGASSQFLKADGSVDGNSYVTVATTQTISGLKTFSNSLTLNNVANTPTDPDKFLVLNGGNVVAYRTGTQVLSDIGAAASSSISGTINYIPKFTSSSTLGNSIIQDNGFTLTLGPFAANAITNIIAGNNNPALISFQNQTSGVLAQITANNAKNLNFSSGGVTTRMTLDPSGNLGLGTITPLYKLDVNGDVNISLIDNALTDTDKILVSDGGVVKYRTGAEILSDIGAVKSYGSFYDILDQSVATASVGQPVLARNTDATITSGFSMISNSRITATNTGKYNIMFSFQLHNNGGGGPGEKVEIWLVKNGTALSDSNTRINVPSSTKYVVAAWNYFVPLNAGDYVEVYWATDNQSIILEHNTGSMGGPTIPSVIITINQID